MVIPKNLPENMQKERCSVMKNFDSVKITDSCQNQSIIEDLTIGEIVIISLIVCMLLCCISTIVYYNYKAFFTVTNYL